MKRIFYSIVIVLFVLIGGYNMKTSQLLKASEIKESTSEKGERLVDPICSYKKELINNNKHVYYFHPDYDSKWWKVDEYNISTSKKGNIDLSFGYGPLSVSYSKVGSGVTKYADPTRYSKLKMNTGGKVYKITDSRCNTRYDFVETSESPYVYYK